MGIFPDNIIKQNPKVVTPFIEDYIGPASIDLSLGNKRYSYKLEEYCLGDNIPDDKVEDEEFESLKLKNNQTVFVGTYEEINIPNNSVGLIMPRSSITRLGLIIQPIFMNPGYKGYQPLTITNSSNIDIVLKPEIRVAQLILFSLTNDPDKTYADVENAKYYNENVESSKIYTDLEIKSRLNEIIKEKAPNLYRDMEKGK